MSEEAQEKEIYITKDDVAAIERFFKHFKFATAKEYGDAQTAFLANPTVDTQKNYRFQLTKEIVKVKGQNELIDDLFKNVIETSDKISYDMQFDKDLEEIVGTDTTNQASTP